MTERHEDTLSAEALFERCREITPLTPAIPLRVCGRVQRVYLGSDKVARIVLHADEKALRMLECRCLSDEVLHTVREGTLVTLEGTPYGLDDSLTGILENCRRIAPEDVQSCRFCGRARGQARRLIHLPRGVLCDECAARCLAQLQREG